MQAITKLLILVYDFTGWLMVAGVVGWIPIGWVVQWLRFGGWEVSLIATSKLFSTKEKLKYYHLVMSSIGEYRKQHLLRERGSNSLLASLSLQLGSFVRYIVGAFMKSLKSRIS